MPQSPLIEKLRREADAVKNSPVLFKVQAAEKMADTTFAIITDFENRLQQLEAKHGTQTAS